MAGILGGGGSGLLPFDEQWQAVMDAMRGPGPDGWDRFGPAPAGDSFASKFGAVDAGTPNPLMAYAQGGGVPMPQPRPEGLLGDIPQPQGGPPMRPLQGMAPQMAQAGPGFGDRLQAAGASFFNAGSPMAALGGLIGGLVTGQRQDPMGIALTERSRRFGEQQQEQQAAMRFIAEADDIDPLLKRAMIANPSLAAQYLEARAKPPAVPSGFAPQRGGGLAPIPGGPSDPAYLSRVNELKEPHIGQQIKQRFEAAKAQGLNVNDPNTKSYILTGRMPREDQQPLSATDKKAILEADEGIVAGETAVKALRQAKELSKAAYEGPFAAERGYITSLGGNEAGAKTTDLNNLVMTNALAQLKSIFGAAPTEGERKILLEIQGSTSQPDAVRQKIYDRAIEMAERRLEFNRQRSNELRGGTFYKTKSESAPTDKPVSSGGWSIKELK